MLAPRLSAVLFLGLLAVPATLRAADVDAYLPPDTESYVAVNVREMLDAPIFKKTLLAPAKQFLDELDEVKGVLKELGLDPFKHIDRLIIASPSSTDTDRGLVIAHGTFDLAKFTKKATDAARDNDEILKIHKVPLGGGATHTVYEVVIPNQDTSLFVALASDKTILASPGKDYVVDAIKQQRAKKKVALKNKEFQALLEKLDAKQSLSLAMMGKSLNPGDDADPILKLFTDAFGGVEAVGGGISFTNEIKLELVVAGKSQAAAQNVRTNVERGVRLGLVGLALLGDERKELSVLLDVLKTVKVSGKGKVVSITGKLTADVLEDFFKKDE